MIFLYSAGVLIGIIALYAVLTLGVGFLIAKNDNDARIFSMAWIFGFILFIIVSIIALNEAGAFDIVRSNEAVEEVEDQ